MILQKQVSYICPSSISTDMNIEIMSEKKQKCTPEIERGDETNTYVCNCNHLYQFIRWGYFVGLIPFKPVIVRTDRQVTEGKSPEVEFRRNKFQTIICWTVYIIGVFWTTLKLTNSYPDGGSLYAKPSRILAVVSVLFQMTYVLSFAYTFGIQGDRLKAVLNCSSPSQKDKAKGLKKFSGMLSMLPIFLATFSTSLQFQEYLLRIPKACVHKDNLQKDSLSSASKVVTFVPLASILDCENLEKFRDLLCFFMLALHFSAELIYNSFQTFLLILALSARNFCLDVPCKVNGLHKLVHAVEKVKKFFQRLNKVGSVPFLLFLCQMIPWTGYRFLDSLPDPKGILQRTSPIAGTREYQESEEVYDVDSGLFVKLYNWCILINGCVIIFFCAETKSLVNGN